MRQSGIFICVTLGYQEFEKFSAWITTFIPIFFRAGVVPDCVPWSSAGSQFSYQWATANGNLVSGQTTLTPTVDQPGAYTLTVSNAENGCTATANITVSELKVTPVANTSTAQDLTCALKQQTLNGSVLPSGLPMPMYGIHKTEKSYPV